LVLGLLVCEDRRLFLFVGGIKKKEMNDGKEKKIKTC
jgi:hypothetical protein